VRSVRPTTAIQSALMTPRTNSDAISAQQQTHHAPSSSPSAAHPTSRRATTRGAGQLGCGTCSDVLQRGQLIYRRHPQGRSRQGPPDVVPLQVGTCPAHHGATSHLRHAAESGAPDLSEAMADFAAADVCEDETLAAARG
jgi:hypothetical protein